MPISLSVRRHKEAEISRPSTINPNRRCPAHEEAHKLPTDGSQLYRGRATIDNALLEAAGPSRARFSHARESGVGDSSDSPPPRRPGARPWAGLFAGLLRGMAHAPRARAAAVRRRTTPGTSLAGARRDAPPQLRPRNELNASPRFGGAELSRSAKGPRHHRQKPHSAGAEVARSLRCHHVPNTPAENTPSNFSGSHCELLAVVSKIAPAG